MSRTAAGSPASPAISSGRSDWRTRAVTRRNFLVYLRNWRSAFVPPVLEPLVMFLVFGMGLGAYVGSIVYQGREVPYLEYVAPGILTYTLFTTSFMESLYGSFVRMFYQKTFEGIVGTAVERVNIIWGEMIWAACRRTREWMSAASLPCSSRVGT